VSNRYYLQQSAFCWQQGAVPPWQQLSAAFAIKGEATAAPITNRNAMIFFMMDFS
jgi:hypothetical protein